jgi:hypothetical protein
MPSNTYVQELVDDETLEVLEDGKLVGCAWKDEPNNTTYCPGCYGEGCCGTWMKYNG